MIQIAHIESPFDSKFGIPRQTGLAQVTARVVFEPPYRVAEAVRGLEEFDYVWLIWQFHMNERQEWSPTVRPPRLGGNRRMGVFATRSPFRPNSIGLSAVRLTGVEMTSSVGPVLHLSGADMANGTPIFDIKPYIPYADAFPDARSGFAAGAPTATLTVEDPEGITTEMDTTLREGLFQSLAQDPRPRYQRDSKRVYTVTYSGREISFRVDEGRLIIVKKTM